MTLQLLQRNRDGARRLALALSDAVDNIGECACCRTLTDQPECELCLDDRRDDNLLCIVESPADIWAIEQAGGFHGYYFVLHGHLSPIDGVGPEQLKLDLLEQRVALLEPEEIILATNATVEGETTAHYIGNLIGDRVANITRIAHGVPLGGELEFIDGGTIVHALQGRRNLN
jgi:recombination protein RecR